MPAKLVTLREAKENINKVCSGVQRRAASVKACYNLSKQIVQREQFPRFPHPGMQRNENISSINPLFIDKVELLKFLTTQVEHLHVVSHFKHKTFSALNYSHDFVTIVKETLNKL